MPDVSNVHTDAILSNISQKFSNAAFVGLQMLPVVQVKKESDKYYKYNSKADRFRVPDTLRAPKTESKQVDWKVTTGTYQCEEHALSDLIDDREKANADKPLNLAVDTVEFLTDLIKLAQEKRIADYLSSSTYMTAYTTLAGTDQWSDYANSDPVGDIETGKETIHGKIFRVPNTLLLGQQVYNKLKHHPDVIDRFKYTNKGIITKEMLADLFEVEKVIVGESGYNTAKEGQTASYSYLWGKIAILAYVEKAPGIKKFSLGYTFQSKKFGVRKARIETKHSDWYETGHVVDEKLVSVDCGYLIKTAIA